MAKKTVNVQYQPDYNLAMLLTAPPHSFIADEPEAEGGDNLGPGPYELLLWALGACTAMTLLLYARRKEWPVEDISVQLTHDRVHTDDAHSAADGAATRVEVIERQISIRGDLDAEQTQRLLEIAGRCPVHRTISSAPRVIDTILTGQ